MERLRTHPPRFQFHRRLAFCEGSRANTPQRDQTDGACWGASLKQGGLATSIQQEKPAKTETRLDGLDLGRLSDPQKPPHFNSRSLN